MSRPGRSLEKLVEILERAIAKQSNVEIESPAKLRDKTTGRLREHDVLLRARSEHHEWITAIECRDRSRKVGVSQIEAFHQKCVDTGVHQGVVVSPKGFCKTAYAKAEAHGIRCFDLCEVDSIDWILGDGLNMDIMIRRHKHTQWTMISAEDDFIATDFTVLDKDGEEVSTKKLQAFLGQQVQKMDEVQEQMVIAFPDLEFKMRDNATGRVVDVTRVVANVELELERKRKPFKLLRYSSGVAQESIRDIAYVDLDDGPVKGRLVIVHSLEKGGNISFIPDDQ